MNVLVTGADGFIGRHLSSHLEGKHTVFRAVLETDSHASGREIALDLADLETVRVFTEGFRPDGGVDAVIHLASRLASFEEINDMDILYDNLRITEGVLELVKALGPAKLINFSSIAVYPNRDGTFSETSEIRTSPNSDCLYGLSKFCGENILDFMLREQEVTVSHLRVSQVRGEGMRGDRIIPVMLRELKEKNTITVYGDGQRVSDFIHVKTLLKVIDQFLESSLQGIYNVGGKEMSYLELAASLIERHGREGSRIIKVPEGSRAKFRINTSKLGNALKGGIDFAQDCQPDGD